MPTATVSVEPATSATSAPEVTSEPSGEPATTAAPTASAAPSVVSWIPSVPQPPTDPSRPRASCPHGNFCLASAPPGGSDAAPAPYEACVESAPRPGQMMAASRSRTQFDAATTQRERASHPGACCYSWHTPCPGGRLLRGSEGTVVAPAIPRDDWRVLSEKNASPPGDAVLATAHERTALAAHWEREAATEHASIAAFARASLSLMAIGAPPELLIETQAAALDEVEHAKIAYSLSSMYSGDSVGPGSLDLRSLGEVARTPAAVAREAIIEGCAGESVAALSLREAAQSALDPAIAPALRRIATDEERHAELAWRTVAFALRSDPEPVKQAILECIQIFTGELLDLASGPAEADALDLSAHGVLGVPAQRRIRAAALSEVVLPCLRALLARAQATAAPPILHPA